jgi:hypothetical protein
MIRTVEMVAAVLLGLSLVWLVFEPLVVERSDPTPAVDPPELEATAHGAALIALKDLELDHATGKISSGDYEELKARYTRVAVSALREERSRPSGSP